jgi:hypothetical protein
MVSDHAINLCFYPNPCLSVFICLRAVAAKREGGWFYLQLRLRLCRSSRHGSGELVLHAVAPAVLHEQFQSRNIAMEPRPHKDLFAGAVGYIVVAARVIAALTQCACPFSVARLHHQSSLAIL